jgi:hypothetical protein
VVGVSSDGKTFTPSVMKIGPMFQKLKKGKTHTEHGDLIELLFLFEGGTLG